MTPEGMTAEEKAGLMQLMGQTYGEAHKQDKMIIGSAGNLQPQSHQLKEQFEQVARTPTVVRPSSEQLSQHPPEQPPEQPPQQPPEQPAPTEIRQVTPEQAAQEIAAVVATPMASPKTGNQLEFDLSEPSKIDKLISLTEKQNLILEQIRLKLDNGKTAKSNKQK